jgi:hypothetical protein
VQARAVESGKPISLAQALLDIGAITPVMKESLEKRLKGEEKKGGAQQLSHYKHSEQRGGAGKLRTADSARFREPASLLSPRKSLQMGTSESALNLRPLDTSSSASAKDSKADMKSIGIPPRHLLSRGSPTRSRSHAGETT